MNRNRDDADSKNEVEQEKVDAMQRIRRSNNVRREKNDTKNSDLIHCAIFLQTEEITAALLFKFMINDGATTKLHVHTSHKNEALIGCTAIRRTRREHLCQDLDTFCFLDVPVFAKNVCVCERTNKYRDISRDSNVPHEHSDRPKLKDELTVRMKRHTTNPIVMTRECE